MQTCILLVFLVLVLHSTPLVQAADQMECAVNALAVRLSGRILPSCVRGNRIQCDAEVDQTAAALGMATQCGVTNPYRAPTLGASAHFITDKVDEGLNTIFVDYASGLDANAGSSRTTPMKTVMAAVLKFRADVPVAASKTIVLMPGKHRVCESIILGPEDSHLTIQGETGAVLTGAMSLANLTWTNNSGVFTSSEIPEEIMSRLDLLSVMSHKGEPAVRAQYPNKKSYIDFNFNSAGSIERWFARPRTTAFRGFMRTLITWAAQRYRFFIQASGGTCDAAFTPPSGYFCDPTADADINCAYSQVGAVQVREGMAGAIKITTWKNLTTGFFHALHPLKWGGWTFQIGDKKPGDDWKTLRFSRGGFQEARGDCAGGGGEFYVENIAELLDAPNEFFLDLQARSLTFYPPSAADFDPTQVEIVTKRTRLISVLGTSAVPVTDLKFVNLRFESTYPTHMDTHETPSGGDWAIHRGGTLFLQGARNVIVADCLFTKLGSHAIFVSNHARDVEILRNTFYGLDGSAILLVGDPKYEAAQPWDRTKDEDYVARVTIRFNMVSEIGLMELQSAAFFGSIAKDVYVERNVMFNGPRAAVVYNDLFGGNLVTRENVMFNLVRLTLDHGPYNVWDRQQWSLPANFKLGPNIVERNYMIGSNGGPKVVDLDDGARDHLIFDNVIAYGYLKFKGGNAQAYNNVVIAYLTSQTSCAYVATSHQRATGFVWRNNKCFAPGGRTRVPYSWALNSRTYCQPPSFTSSDNAFYGIQSTFGKCGKLGKWKRRNDRRSVFSRAVQAVSTAMAASEALMVNFGMPLPADQLATKGPTLFVLSSAPSSVAPTSMPSTVPPTSAPSHAPATSEPSASPSQSPFTSNPSTSPATSVPSESPVTSEPSASPSQVPSQIPSTGPAPLAG